MENKNVLELKWGNKVPIPYNDPRYGAIELNIYGICHYSINNSNINAKQIEDLLYQNIINCVNSIIATIKDEYYEKIAICLTDKLNGMVISTFQMQDITVQNLEVRGVSLTESSNQKVEDQKIKKVKESMHNMQNQVKVVQTDIGAKDGQNKCPKCGSTEISTNMNTGKLRCRFCRCEFEPEKVQGLETDLSNLQGQVLASGAQDIVADVNDVLTFKCSSCGAEVVIDTSESTNARCHWCRSTLSVNQQIPNGSIPDVVLPFTVKKEEAQAAIEKFVGGRKFFAHPKFKSEFTTNNIMGVYFPYMIVDVNSHVNLVGQGEHLVRTYHRGSGNDRKTYYDADLYNVQREFDLVIDGLTVESSADRLNHAAADKTNNVINAIMPFDLENSVKWNSNYLRGFTSEKRDTNIDQLRPLVDNQSKDIARFAANETLKEYDRGVAWSNEQLTVKGQQWKSAYLPVWLYSYQQSNGKLHYVAVNARTKETMGSVPIHQPMLLLMTFLVEIIGIILMLFIDFDYNWAFLLAGPAYYAIMYSRYRNSGARHKHELETKKKMDNLRKVDQLVTRRTGLRNYRMEGANNLNVSGQSAGSQFLNELTQGNPVASFIKENMDKNDNNSN